MARAFPQVPLLFNWAEGGKTPPMPFERLKELGYRLIIFPISALLVAAKAVREVMAQIRKDGTPINAARDFMSFKEFNALAGLGEIQEIERQVFRAEVAGSSHQFGGAGIPVVVPKFFTPRDENRQPCGGLSA